MRNDSHARLQLITEMRSKLLLPLLAAGCLSHGIAASAAELSAAVKGADGAPVLDAVVLAFPSGVGVAATKQGSDTIDQVDYEFVPRVKVIKVGTMVNFPNKDNIRHQVYSFSPAKPFELPLYAGVRAPPVLFDKPGIVIMGCNIHDSMVGYVYVADTAYFGKTNADGKVRIDTLPSGRYTLRVWHPRMIETEESTARRVSTSDAAPTAWTLTLKAEFRTRRAPDTARPACER